MPLPNYQSPMQGGQLSASQLAKLQRDVQSLMRPQAGGAGMNIRTSPFGNYLQDNRPDEFLAIIQADHGSGSGNDGLSGSGVARDQPNAYAWREAMPMYSADSYIIIEKPGGRFGSIDARPAMEANQNSDVEVGTVVWLYPGTGQPDFYFFFAGEGVGNGSGHAVTITCSDGSHHTATISGDSIVVS